MNHLKPLTLVTSGLRELFRFTLYIFLLGEFRTIRIYDFYNFLKNSESASKKESFILLPSPLLPQILINL